jgi:tRNA nucleotidyltransferase (CCA-adding enzyme)
LTLRVPDHIQIYVVGGAVRDRLLGLASGLPAHDRDHVVVGATPEEMTALGFQPVGKDFPVFLHPRTHEEYALARTERKTARGYKGFQVYATPDVSLEEDLRRRDLTINAIAESASGEIIDPYGGRADLAARVFRHVSEAFAEDPVRILRVARFAARFTEFTVAPETLAMMRRMVANAEVDALVPERVWQEFARGLMEARPSRMFLLLHECGALAKLLPEVDVLFGVPQSPKSHPEIDTGDHVMRVIDRTAAHSHPLPVRYAALLHDLGKGLTPPENWPNHSGHEAAGIDLVKQVGQRLRAPSDCSSLAQIVARWHGQAHNADKMGAAGLLDLLEQTDALRRPDRFDDFLHACTADFQGRPGYEDRAYIQAERLRQALAAARQIDAGAIARLSTPTEIQNAIHDARLQAIALEFKQLLKTPT